METSNKAVVSGRLIEFYEFTSRPLKYGAGSRDSHKPIGGTYWEYGHEYGAFREDGNLIAREIRHREIEPETKEEYIERSIRRASTQMKRLISSNHEQHLETENLYFTTKFLTLTLADPSLVFLKQTNLFFTDFIRRLNRHIYGNDLEHRKLIYISVPEFQKRGVVHYHTLLFNMPYTPQKKLQEIWESGLKGVTPTETNPNGIKGIVHIQVKRSWKICFYLTKYLTKNFHDPTLAGRRKYFPSFHLLRPKNVYDESTVIGMQSSIPPEYLTKPPKEFYSSYCGNVKYTSFLVPNSFTINDNGI